MESPYREEPVDAKCVTTGDGGCVGSGCMHDGLTTRLPASFHVALAEMDGLLVHTITDSRPKKDESQQAMKEYQEESGNLFSGEYGYKGDPEYTEKLYGAMNLASANEIAKTFDRKIAELVAGTKEVHMETILEEAERIGKDRSDSYDSPKPNHEKIAGGWGLIVGTEITAEQVALMMIWMKVVRQNHAPKRDNLVDIAGYARAIERMQG